MKKTLTINLNGTVFHIDEDAYELLRVYLDNLRNYFKHTQGGHEIVQDMESRIAEIFQEYLQSDGQVITIERVEQLIQRLGQPEDLAMDADGISNEEQGAGSRQANDETVSNKHTRKRLLRDMSDRQLGGVCSGIAAYLEVDPTWVRIAFILLALFTKIIPILIIYFILQAILPPAYSATDRLRMKGKPINIETIGETVADTFKRQVEAPHTRSFFRNLTKGLFSIVAFCVKAFFLFIAICLLPLACMILFVFSVLFLAAFGVVASIPAWLINSVTYIDWPQVALYPGYTLALLICCILSFGIAIYWIVTIVMQLFGYKIQTSNGWTIFLIILWLLVVTVGIALFVYAPYFNPLHWNGALIEM